MMSNNTAPTTLLFTFEGPIAAFSFGAVITAWTVNNCRVRTDHVVADPVKAGHVETGHVEMSVYGAPVDILTLLRQYAKTVENIETGDYYLFPDGTVVTWHYAPEGWDWPSE